MLSKCVDSIGDFIHDIYPRAEEINQFCLSGASGSEASVPLGVLYISSA
jgi:hypothetical protein